MPNSREVFAPDVQTPSFTIQRRRRGRGACPMRPVHPDTPWGDEPAEALATEIRALSGRGARSRAALIRLVDRGDWRTRVLALSALGQMVRDDPAAARAWSITGRALAAIPGVRRRVPTVGYRGRLISRSLLNAAIDPSFLVRTAAALALGECRDPDLCGELTPLVRDPFQPVRRAAAVALVACGHHGPQPPPSDTGGEPTPAQVAEGVETRPWLCWLARAHAGLIRAATDAGERMVGRTPEDHADWLAGPLHTAGHGGAAVEAARYDHEADLSYQLAKPFGAQDRAENIRQLDAFVALVAQLALPRGARLLDLGGGSGWVGELLARFGFEAVVVDVARPLLRLARQRFDAAGLPGWVVAGDMTALPFRAQSFDAVIAIDALHHVEDLGSVLREARRMLVQGGVFLIAEPGEGHAERPKSLAESWEQGVREGEISPFALATLASEAGFDRAVMLPRVPSLTTMDVEDVRRAMRQPAEAWRVWHEGIEARFATHVVRSMLARPLMVLSAGTRPADTRSPATLRAEIAPALVRDGRMVTGHVDVINTGDTTWLAESDAGVGVVSVGLQLLASDGRMLGRDFWRGRLPARVSPGGSARVSVTAELPDAQEPYRLKCDLVAEHVCWFEDRGSRPSVADLA